MLLDTSGLFLCIKCQQQHPYHRMTASKKGGKLYKPQYCKVCSAERAKKWRVDSGKFREQARMRQGQYNRNNPLISQMASVRMRAKEKGIECDICTQDLLEIYTKQDGKCYWFGLPLKLDASDYGTPMRVSIDRLDNDRGYTKDNIVLTCQAANLGRNQHSEEVWAAFIKELKDAFIKLNII